MSCKLLYSDFILWIAVLQSPWLMQWGWFFGALPAILVSFVLAVSHCSTSLGVLYGLYGLTPLPVPKKHTEPRGYQLVTFGAVQSDLAMNKMKILKCSSVKWKEFFTGATKQAGFSPCQVRSVAPTVEAIVTLQKGCTEEREDKGCVLAFYIEIIILALWERLSVLADIRSWKQWLHRTLCLEN